MLSKAVEDIVHGLYRDLGSVLSRVAPLSLSPGVTLGILSIDSILENIKVLGGKDERRERGGGEGEKGES